MTEVVYCGSLVLDKGEARAFWNGADVDLKPLQYAIVELLVSADGLPLTYDQIYDAVKHKGCPSKVSDDGYMAVRRAVSRIRESFRRVDLNFNSLKTLRNGGYMWLISRPHPLRTAMDGTLAVA